MVKKLKIKVKAGVQIFFSNRKINKLKKIKIFKGKILEIRRKLSILMVKRWWQRLNLSFEVISANIHKYKQNPNALYDEKIQNLADKDNLLLENSFLPNFSKFHDERSGHFTLKHSKEQRITSKRITLIKHSNQKIQLPAISSISPSSQINIGSRSSKYSEDSKRNISTRVKSENKIHHGNKMIFGKRMSHEKQFNKTQKDLGKLPKLNNHT